MTIELLGTKMLIVQMFVPLPPGADPHAAANEFMARLQVPAGYVANGVKVAIGIVDQAPPANDRLNGIVPGA